MTEISVKEAIKQGAEPKFVDAPIKLVNIKLERMRVPIVSESELIMNKWSEKAKEMMRKKQAGEATKRKVGRKPEEEYKGSMYTDGNGGYCFPSTGFKAAIVTACRQMKNVPMTLAKVALRVDGEFSPIWTTPDSPYMREDMVRLETGVADFRYRAGFPVWKSLLMITYNADMLTKEQVANMVLLSGMGGIGDWRPSAPKSYNGMFGCYRIADWDNWKEHCPGGENIIKE